MIRQATLLLVFIFLALETGLAQGKASFEASADARDVLLDSYFDVTFTLRNGEGENFQAPVFRDFVVVEGPARSISTTIINGAVSRVISFTYTLKPRRTGRLTVPAASISVAGKTLSTQALVINVIKGAANASKSDRQPFLIRAEPSSLEAYIGQQILLDYKLFTTIDIESYNVLEESDYPGFYAEDLKRYDGRVMREIVGGQQYTTKVLKRVALFPQQAGELIVDPLQLQLGVVDEGDDQSGSFFFNRSIRRLPVQTDPVSIRVKPLPEERPEGFNGAVGRFTMNSSLARPTLTTNDVLALQVTISGNGDIKRVLPPVIDFPDSFEVYEPKILEEQTSEIDGELISRKTFEYLALPQTAGTFELQAEFTYFHSDSARFVTIQNSPYAITVRPGASSGETVDPLPGAAIDENDIRFIKTKVSLYRGGDTFFGSSAFWMLSAAPFLLFGGFLGLRRLKLQRERVDPAERRSRQARKVALERLKAAEGFRLQNQPRAFFDEVSKAFLGYVGDKLRIPRSEMSKENVRDRLQSLQVDPADVDRFLNIMQTCEMALFAGRDHPQAMEETYRQALELLATLEQRIGMVRA